MKMVTKKSITESNDIYIEKIIQNNCGYIPYIGINIYVN